MKGFYDKPTKERFLATIFSPKATMEVLDWSGAQLCVLSRDNKTDVRCNFEGEVLRGGHPYEFLISLGDVALLFDFEENIRMSLLDTVVFKGTLLHITMNEFYGTTYEQWQETQK